VPENPARNERERFMLIVTQIRVGSNMIADGSMLIEDAVMNDGFITKETYTARELELAENNLRKAADRIATARAALLMGDPGAPKAILNLPVAAE
jgi:hypothetical protein